MALTDYRAPAELGVKYFCLSGSTEPSGSVGILSTSLTAAHCPKKSRIFSGSLHSDTSLTCHKTEIQLNILLESSPNC